MSGRVKDLCVQTRLLFKDFRDVRTIGFRAPGCALISTVCSSVLCSLVVVFEVMKKRNLY